VALYHAELTQAAASCQQDPTELQIGFYSQAHQQMVIGAEGGAAPLTDAPQGGSILAVFPRAHNLVCTPVGMNQAVDVSASIRDETTGRVLVVTGGNSLAVPGADGWTVPFMPTSATFYTNVGGCPLAAATRSIVGQVYLLHMTADFMGKHAETSLHVIPTCDETTNPAHCQCVCGAMGGGGASCM
jgi:hypothetical protein